MAQGSCQLQKQKPLLVPSQQGLVLYPQVPLYESYMAKKLRYQKAWLGRVTDPEQGRATLGVSRKPFALSIPAASQQNPSFMFTLA